MCTCEVGRASVSVTILGRGPSLATGRLRPHEAGSWHPGLAADGVHGCEGLLSEIHVFAGCILIGLAVERRGKAGSHAWLLRSRQMRD